MLKCDDGLLLTINRKLTIQYVSEQPKITDSTIFRRIKLKKKALHMTGDWHQAFSETEYKYKSVLGCN
jgi:hypothetical protein